MSDFTIVMNWERARMLAESLDVLLIVTHNGFDLEGMHLNSLEEVSAVLRYEEYLKDSHDTINFAIEGEVDLHDGIN